jgi:hypothetical protein
VIRIASLLLVASLIVSGCAGGQSQSAQTEPSSSVIADEGLTDGGTIRGLVVDDQNAPVSGVEIGLKGVAVTATSDDAGAFSIENLEPGEHTLFAQRLGYESSSKQVTVAAQEVVDVTLVLEPLPIAEAYKETIPKSITIDVGLGWSVGGDSGQGCPAAGVACNSAAYPGADTKFKLSDPKGTPLASIVFEASWTANSAVCAKTLRLRLYSPGANTGNPSDKNFGHWTNDPHPRWKITNPVVMDIPRAPDGTKDAIDSPERMELNGGELTVKGDWTARTFPPGRGLTNTPVDLNCFTQQKIDLWMSAFYLEPAPVGFSARADA